MGTFVKLYFLAVLNSACYFLERVDLVSDVTPVGPELCPLPPASGVAVELPAAAPGEAGAEAAAVFKETIRHPLSLASSTYVVRDTIAAANAPSRLYGGKSYPPRLKQRLKSLNLPS